MRWPKEVENGDSMLWLEAGGGFAAATGNVGGAPCRGAAAAWLAGVKVRAASR